MELNINLKQVESIRQQIKNILVQSDIFFKKGKECEKNAEIYKRCWHECHSEDLRNIMFIKTNKELDQAHKNYSYVARNQLIQLILLDFSSKYVVITEKSYDGIKLLASLEKVQENLNYVYNQVESILSYADIECGEFLHELAKILNIKLVV